MEATARTRGTRFGAFEVDLRAGEVYKHGIRLKLQDQPFQLLASLLEHPGEVVTREALRERLWPADTFVDFDTGLNSAIKKLRDVLGDSADEPRYIETLPRRGYRFIAAVESAVLPVAASEGTAHGVQSNENATKALELNDSAGSSRTSRPTVTHFPRGLKPSLLSLKTRPEARQQKMRVGLAIAMALAFLALSGMLVVSRRSSRNLPVPISSVAVLPLENLTGDPSQDYFVDGMTDALITELAQVRGLKVISRTSAMQYKGARKTLPEIARELNVDAVVEGTVARSGERVKITAQLIRASTDTHVWAGSYGSIQSDILRLQAEVAREVTRQISEQLVPAEDKAKAKPSINPEAYDAYLRGLFALNKQSPDGVGTAIRYFQAAIEKDPKFAAAYSRLASCYATLAYLSEMPSAKAYRAAKEAVEKALALDDNLDHAHIALAWVAKSDWDWARAESEYKRALQLNPNSADAHIGYFYLLLITGRSEEATREEQAAVASDPLSLHTMSTSLSSAYHRRQYAAGLVKARTAIDLYPEVSSFHVFLSNFYAAQGSDKLSAAELLLAEETGGASPERLASLKKANEVAGTKGLRRKRIELNKKVAAGQSMNAYDIAIDCAAVGDRDQALLWLEKALRTHDAKISLIGVEPIFDGIRSDPRFVGFLRQMGLNGSHA